MANETDGVSQTRVPEMCFQIRGGWKWTGLNKRRRSRKAKCLRRRAALLSHRLTSPSMDTFSAMAITVSALSYSAISQTPPPPQPPNPIHIILQSSSSCSPGLSIFYFPFSPSSSSLSSSTPSIFSNTLPTVQPVSLTFLKKNSFSLFHSLTQSGQSFSSLTRSKPQPCSELLKVRKWRCNVIEWLGNRIYEGWVWSC